MQDTKRTYSVAKSTEHCPGGAVGLNSWVHRGSINQLTINLVAVYWVGPWTKIEAGALF